MASAVDVVVHLDLDSTGRRRVREIVSLSGRVENGVIETSPLYESRGTRLVRADGFPPHQDRFSRAGFDLGSLLGSGSGG
ncbi:MAG: hypothetical protein JJE50_13215 [Actinomycetales bacterium]|nr:hypothetical protein [Actinomycetales bacterium]